MIVWEWEREVRTSKGRTGQVRTRGDRRGQIKEERQGLETFTNVV